MTADQLAAIIVTHNSSAVIVGAIETIDAADRACVRVFDNGSTDDTVARVRAAAVRAVELGENLGYAAAGNRAARAVDARVLCFLNPDCRASSATLRQGLEIVRAADAVCAAPVLDEGGETVPGRQPGYTAITIAAEVLACGYGRGPVAWMRRLPGYHDESWSWPHGACWFVDRRRFLDLGGFNQQFSTYMEDVDFGRRWHAAGGTVRQLDARVPHLARQGARVSASRRHQLLLRARLQYAREHHGAALSSALRVAVAPGLLARRVMWGS
jgi:GT2 family glycosyltransferase